MLKPLASGPPVMRSARLPVYWSHQRRVHLIGGGCCELICWGRALCCVWEDWSSSTGPLLARAAGMRSLLRGAGEVLLRRAVLRSGCSWLKPYLPSPSLTGEALRSRSLPVSFPANKSPPRGLLGRSSLRRVCLRSSSSSLGSIVPLPIVSPRASPSVVVVSLAFSRVVVWVHEIEATSFVCTRSLLVGEGGLTDVEFGVGVRG
ncbi:hypothetical protein KCU92_g244, partial [Aureobasidium melanogenum]